MTDQTRAYYTGYEPPPSGTYVPGGTEDPSMKDKAAESAEAGKQAATDVAQTAADQAKQVASEAQTQAKNLLGEARDQFRSHTNDQHRNAVTNLRALGDELRSMAANGQPGGAASNVVGQAADRAHGAADWLDGRQPEDVLAEVRRFAQRRPGAFLLGALAAGVVAGRLTRGIVAAHGDDNGQLTATDGSQEQWSTPVTGGTAEQQWPEQPEPSGAAGQQWPEQPAGGQWADPATGGQWADPAPGGQWPTQGGTAGQYPGPGGPAEQYPSQGGPAGQWPSQPGGPA